MAKLDISRFLVYRWRYILGYGLVGLLLAGLMVFAALYIPGGISPEEVNGVIVADSIRLSDPTTWATPNLPYYLFQKASYFAFGVHEFTIKLPSLILGLLSALGLIALLRRWFRPNIAVLASMIAVTTGQFLFIAQNGVPGILYVFWPVVLLLLGTQITRVAKHRVVWKMLFAVAVALSLYTPLSLYTLLAIAITISLHPHLRNAVRKLSKLKILIGALIVAVLVAPLVLGVVISPSLGLTLLGIPTAWPDFWQNIITLSNQYFLFWEPSTTTLMTPVFGLGSMMLLGLGLYRLVITRDTTRSYLIIIWLICLVPIITINPNFTSITFVPAVLLFAAGITSLISYWYRLFPLNPYARIAGLVPLIVIVAVLIGSGIDRFVYGYHYDPNTAINFSKDLRLIPDKTHQIIVSDDERAFYDVVAKYDSHMVVVDKPTDDSFVATRSAKKNFEGYHISQIITTTYKDNADRMYVYQKTE